MKDNINIQITGFNESRSLTTRIIECSINVLNNTRYFQAVIVPEIKSKIPISSVQLIRKTFDDNSVPLADKQLFRENDGTVVSFSVLILPIFCPFNLVGLVIVICR